jgi:hypothetical protein
MGKYDDVIAGERDDHESAARLRIRVKEAGHRAADELTPELKRHGVVVATALQRNGIPVVEIGRAWKGLTKARGWNVAGWDLRTTGQWWSGDLENALLWPETQPVTLSRDGELVADLASVLATSEIAEGVLIATNFPRLFILDAELVVIRDYSSPVIPLEEALEEGVRELAKAARSQHGR